MADWSKSKNTLLPFTPAKAAASAPAASTWATGCTGFSAVLPLLPVLALLPLSDTTGAVVPACPPGLVLAQALSRAAAAMTAKGRTFMQGSFIQLGRLAAGW